MTKVQQLLWKVYGSWAVYHKTLSRQILQRFLGRTQKCRDQFDENDSQELHCAKQTSEKIENKGPSLGKIQVKLPHQRSHHAMKFEDRSHEETERQQRCARSKAWNLAKKIYQGNLQARKGRQSYILFTLWGVDFDGLIHNNPRRKRVCGRFRSEHAHGQQERPERNRIGDREDIEKNDNGSDSQRRSANKRRGNGTRPWIGFIRDSNASWKYTGSSFHLENSAKNMGTVTIGWVARNHTSSKMARNFTATHQIMYHSSYLVYPRVPLPHLLLPHLPRRKLWQTRKF